MDRTRAVDPAGTSARNRAAQRLFRGLPARYDLLAEVLSFGQNRRWRRALVDAIAAGHPARVCDVATGTAGVALALVAAGATRVVGVDLSEPMLQEGVRRATRGAPGRIALAAGRAEALPFPDGRFDALSFTYLLRYVDDPAATLRELARVVAPGGTVAALDFAVPEQPVWRSAWWCYTRLVLPVGGLLGGRAWVRVGRFLGPNISAFGAAHPVADLVDAWERAGIHDVQVRTMSLGGGRVMWGTRATP